MKPRTAVDALRAAGYQRLPPLWVTEDQADVIIRMAKGNEGAITAIRLQAKRDAERDGA